MPDRNGVLHGVAAATGVEIWHTAPVVNATHPVLADGLVYITGTDHRVHGFDLQTGVDRWSWTTTADLSNALGIAADAAYVGSHDGVLHAVALAGSQELWSFQLNSTEVGQPIITADVAPGELPATVRRAFRRAVRPRSKQWQASLDLPRSIGSPDHFWLRA